MPETAVRILFDTSPVSILSSNLPHSDFSKEIPIFFFKAGVAVETSAKLDLQTQSADFPAGPLRPAFGMYLVKQKAN